MKYLLDTHALIWCLEADNQLSVTAQGIISDDNTDIYVSIVSLWEMAIKISLGKLQLSQPLEHIINSKDFGFYRQYLPIRLYSTAAV